MSDELNAMPVVTVEQIVRFRDAALIEIESLQRQVAELEKSLGIDAVEGLETENFQLEQEIINLKAKITANSDEFKNFHRMLCERFGYTHDENYWRRDQVSLIEYLATANSERAAEPVAWLVTHPQHDSSVTQEKWLADAIKREHPNFTVTALGIIASHQSLPEVKEE